VNILSLLLLGESEGPAKSPGGGGFFDPTTLMFIVLIFGVFYFFMIRPQKKRERERREMLSRVGKGAQVRTIAGWARGRRCGRSGGFTAGWWWRRRSMLSSRWTRRAGRG